MNPQKLYFPVFLILMIISGSISGQTEDFMDRPISKKAISEKSNDHHKKFSISSNTDKSKIKTTQFELFSAWRRGN